MKASLSTDMTEMRQQPLGHLGSKFSSKSVENIYKRQLEGRWLEQSEPGPGGSPTAGVARKLPNKSISVGLVRP